MPAEVLFAGVPTASLGIARDWYEALLGRPADVIATDNEVMWQICESGWLYLIHDPVRAGRALVTVAVSDLDASIEQMAARGIERPTVETIPGAGRRASVIDPEGNTVAFIEVIDSAG